MINMYLNLMENFLLISSDLDRTQMEL